ncbi:MAG: ion channel [Pseudomonadales bacterium]|nr:ion channel [Pseudomonadales bacterium]
MKLPRIAEEISDTIKIFDIEKGADVQLKRIDFVGIVENGRPVSVENADFVNCLFSYEAIRYVNFHSCTFTECQFNGAKIENCEFHQCTFVESIFYKTSIHNTYLDPKSFKFSSKWKKHWPNVNAWWFQSLYRNAKDIHQEPFARSADRSYQFYRRYEYLNGRKKKPFRFFIGWLYAVLLGYGYGVLNSLISTCVFISLFAVLMQNRTSHSTSHLQEPAGFVEHIYFAVVSFTTVGYGEVTAIHSNMALVITTIFLFLSFVWGSLVTAVIVKRLVQ